MNGFNTLWQPGTDHAGIATQMVVERNLSEKNIYRKDLTREEFIKKVWEWKEYSGSTIINQLKRLGSSCDWSRERFTMDEGLSSAVRKVFVTLYKEGLIYKDQALVNWDTKFKQLFQIWRLFLLMLVLKFIILNIQLMERMNL